MLCMWCESGWVDTDISSSCEGITLYSTLSLTVNTGQAAGAELLGERGLFARVLWNNQKRKVIQIISSLYHWNLKLNYSLVAVNNWKFVKFWNVLHNILISSNRFFLKVSFSSFTLTLSEKSKISFLASASINNDFS